jgi:DNA end-binding protein Ku
MAGEIMRPIWTGMLSFGLVNIPVSLVPATKKQAIHFNQLRKSDYSRISYKKVAAADGKEVPADQIVKGYEITPDSYVVISEDELEQISPKQSRVISIEDFCRLEEIDPRHYDASYYLVPNEGAGKAYALLLKALQEANVVGIAKMVKHQKEYLVAIRPTEGALSLSTMLFPAELVSTTDLEVDPDIELSGKELSMAKLLIESQISSFDPNKYSNEYYNAVHALIESKAEKEQIASTVESGLAPAGKVIDIMAALEASIQAIKKQEKPKKKRKTG